MRIITKTKVSNRESSRIQFQTLKHCDLNNEPSNETLPADFRQNGFSMKKEKKMLSGRSSAIIWR